MAIKCGETITISFVVYVDSVYSAEVTIRNPAGELVDTLTTYSVQELDDGRYRVTFLYTLPSGCTEGIWQANITIRPSADTCQKETVKFYVAGG